MNILLNSEQRQRHRTAALSAGAGRGYILKTDGCTELALTGACGFSLFRLVRFDDVPLRPVGQSLGREVEPVCRLISGGCVDSSTTLGCSTFFRSSRASLRLL